ncbi:Putative F-box protein PP2-B8 [Linum perenne]
MDELPEECVEKVMSFAGPLQTSQLAVLSRTLRSASQSEKLWEGFLPVGYESVIAQSSSHNLLWISDARQLMRRLCHRPLLIDRGKKVRV